MGVRHIRTNVQPNEKKIQRRLKDLANIGIKSNLVMDPRKLSLKDAVQMVKDLGNSVVQSVEGPNEWNAQSNLKYEYKGQSFPTGVKNYQSDLYSAIKNEPATAQLPILAPSMSAGNNIERSLVELGKVQCDANNMHSYPGGKMPSTRTLDVNFIKYSKISCGEDKPLIATETGYHNALDRNGISEIAAGRYTPRLFLEYFNRGIERTYIYELLNKQLDPSSSDRKGSWGLLKADGSRKKAFTATRNLINILKESDTQTSNSSLESLDYTLQGDTTDINHTLLQKKDGKFYLILWQEVPSYDFQTKSNIKVPHRSLKLILNTKISRANLYKPNSRESTVKTYANPTKISIGVPDHPLVIELIPRN